MIDGFLGFTIFTLNGCHLIPELRIVEKFCQVNSAIKTKLNVQVITFLKLTAKLPKESKINRGTLI